MTSSKFSLLHSAMEFSGWVGFDISEFFSFFLSMAVEKWRKARLFLQFFIQHLYFQLDNLLLDNFYKLYLHKILLFLKNSHNFIQVFQVCSFYNNKFTLFSFLFSFYHFLVVLHTLLV